MTYSAAAAAGTPPPGSPPALLFDPAALPARLLVDDRRAPPSNAGLPPAGGAGAAAASPLPSPPEAGLCLGGSPSTLDELTRSAPACPPCRASDADPPLPLLCGRDLNSDDPSPSPSSSSTTTAGASDCCRRFAGDDVGDAIVNRDGPPMQVEEPSPPDASTADDRVPTLLAASGSFASSGSRIQMSAVALPGRGGPDASPAPAATPPEVPGRALADVFAVAGRPFNVSAVIGLHWQKQRR